MFIWIKYHIFDITLSRSFRATYVNSIEFCEFGFWCDNWCLMIVLNGVSGLERAVSELPRGGVRRRNKQPASRRCRFWSDWWSPCTWHVAPSLMTFRCHPNSRQPPMAPWPTLSDSFPACRGTPRICSASWREKRTDWAIERIPCRLG